jgi:alpha-galactosidase
MQFKQFYFKYTAGGALKEIRSDKFSVYESEALRLEFLLEEPQGDKRYKVQLSPKTSIVLIDFYIEAQMEYGEAKGIFCNGFQSWTETKIFDKEDKLSGQRNLARPLAIAYSDGLLYDYKNKKGELHSWTYTYIRLPKRKIQFLGSLNDKDGYTLFEHSSHQNKIIIRKDCSGTKVEDEFLLMDIFSSLSTGEFCFENYFELQQLVSPLAKPAIGWTSWYYYYTAISEKIIEENLNAFKENNIPVEIFQIDDGYQRAVGDWLNFNERFPNGLEKIVSKIHAQNCKAGLWLAPLACEQNSFIVKEKPEWILKDEKGNFLKIGFNPAWSYWFYALDVYNEEVRAYLRKVFDTVLKDWKFDLVKLDFLYGTALVARNGRSRGQVMSDAMQFLRECAGDKMILGCGVPLSAAIGTTDYCRIGPDIHLKWDFKLLKWIRARERPSTLNAIHNTISRRQLSGKWFWNDPDVFILRKNKNSLSFDEKYSLLLANLLFGHLIFTSDNIREYNSEMLFLYKSIFPLMQPEDVHVSYSNKFYRIHFRIRDRFYLALINTGDSSRMFRLPDNLFYDNVKDEIITGGKMIEIPRHTSKCYLTIGRTPFAIAGTSGHFFSGTEIENIYLSGNKVELEWTEGLLNEVRVFIKVPIDYQVESINNSGNFTRVDKKDFSIIEVEKHKL